MIDHKTLLTIVITALLSASAQKLLAGISWLLKILLPTAAIKEKVSAMSSPINRRMIWDAIFLAIAFSGLVFFARDNSPTTRVSVIEGCILFISTLAWATMLAFDIGAAIARREVSK